jgi:ribosome-associated protein
MIDDETARMVEDIAQFIEDHKGSQTVCIDVSEISSWTGSFVITTVQSAGHLRGLLKELKGFLHEYNLEIGQKHKKISENGWELIDCGEVVIHLMSREAREFYELEKLWHSGRIISEQRA